MRFAAGEWRPNKTGTRERGSFGAAEKKARSALNYLSDVETGGGWTTGRKEKKYVCRWLDLADDLVHVLSGFSCCSTTWRVHTLHFLLTPNVDVARLRFSKVSPVLALTR